MRGVLVTNHLHSSFPSKGSRNTFIRGENVTVPFFLWEIAVTWWEDHKFKVTHLKKKSQILFLKVKNISAWFWQTWTSINNCLGYDLIITCMKLRKHVNKCYFILPEFHIVSVTFLESKELLFCITVCITTAWNYLNNTSLIESNFGILWGKWLLSTHRALFS